MNGSHLVRDATHVVQTVTATSATTFSEGLTLRQFPSKRPAVINMAQVGPALLSESNRIHS
jgi:hypothetical protein